MNKYMSDKQVWLSRHHKLIDVKHGIADVINKFGIIIIIVIII